MAVTAIWRINGWLGNVVLYVENPEKTDNPKFYETSKKGAQGLSDVIDYAVNVEKTQITTTVIFSVSSLGTDRRTEKDSIFYSARTS